MAQRIVTCPHCGEWRDASNRYTSPANARRDALDWEAEHGAGQCGSKRETKREECS